MYQHKLNNKPPLGYLLGATYFGLSGLIQKEFNKTKCDLTFEQLKVLMLLIKKPEVTHTQMAELLHRKKPAITKLLDHLEQKEYITKQVDAEDRRSKKVFPTQRAKFAVKKMEPLAHAVIKEVTQNIDPNEINVFLKVIEQMFHNIKSKNEE